MRCYDIISFIPLVAVSILLTIPNHDPEPILPSIPPFHLHCHSVLNHSHTTAPNPATPNSSLLSQTFPPLLSLNLIHSAVDRYSSEIPLSQRLMPVGGCN